jgi:hypothetical protein
MRATGRCLEEDVDGAPVAGELIEEEDVDGAPVADDVDGQALEQLVCLCEKFMFCSCVLLEDVFVASQLHRLSIIVPHSLSGQALRLARTLVRDDSKVNTHKVLLAECEANIPAWPRKHPQANSRR